MSNFTERQRLWITIGLSALVAGGLTALILMDREKVRQLRDEITQYDQRISRGGREDQPDSAAGR